MKPIQDRIIKDFRDNFCQLETSPSGDTFHIIAYNERNPEKYYRFLMSVIKEVEEETRKEGVEVINEIIQTSNENSSTGWFDGLRCARESMLSITNKEIKK